MQLLLKGLLLAKHSHCSHPAPHFKPSKVTTVLTYCLHFLGAWIKQSVNYDRYFLELKC